MLIESVITQVSNHIFLALMSAERWDVARYPFGSVSAAEAWLTGFAMTALIIAVILVFWVTIQHRRLEERLKKEIAALKADNEELRQQITELSKKTTGRFSRRKVSEKSEEPVAT